MSDNNIYQAIWDADMEQNGIKPVSSKEEGNETDGYVVVDLETCQPQHNVFKEVSIPDKKKNSYELVTKLFNNYSLNQKKKENNTLDEEKEVEEFLKMAIETKPMELAKQYIEENSNKTYSDLQWYTYLHDIWFRQFNSQSGMDLCAFEHVFVGEQKGTKLGGHHFWYKYWLEDNASVENDHILMSCPIDKNKNPSNHDAITVGYSVDAFDYEKQQFTKLFKKIGGFFVGLSAEGIIALGTVRFTPQSFAPKDAVINNVHYQLKLFRSPDNKSMRTFYPVYIPSQNT